MSLGPFSFSAQSCFPMKVKQTPEDFQVEEVTDLQVHSFGDFALYRLTKRNLGTPEAIQEIARTLQLAVHRIQFGGLKDTHALTTQHITIAKGAARGWQRPAWKLEYLGRVSEPFTSRHIAGNRFTIRVRDLNERTLAKVLRKLPDIAATGIANYFDDQRFGSVAPDGQFMARRWIAGDVEGALKLALAASYAFDRPSLKKAKHLMLREWGHWDTLSRKLPDHLRRVAGYLARRPGDYRGAIRLLPHTLLTLYLAAYQSDLWNRMLARWFLKEFPPERFVVLGQKNRTVPMPGQLRESERQRLLSTCIPLPSARLKLPDDSPWSQVISEVLQEEGITLADLKIKHLREVFFSKGERAVWFVPQDWNWQVEHGDQPAVQHLLLRFILPRGCYATLVVKRVRVVAQEGSNSMSFS